MTSGGRNLMADEYSPGAVDALLRVSEIEDHKARKAYLAKLRQVRELESQLAHLQKRRESVLRRGNVLFLHERLLLDALLKITLERKRDLDRLRAQATALLNAYREANGRKQAVSELRRKRRSERELAVQRRSEEAAGDLAASRIVRERGRGRLNMEEKA
jgi:hypothetical protein